MTTQSRSSAKTATGPRPVTGGGSLVSKLARPGDPYIMTDGQRIQPEGQEVNPKDTKFQVQAKTFKSTRRRTPKEMPAEPKMMKGIACVLLFTLLGLSDRDIAEALNISTDDVKHIRGIAAYSETFEMVSDEFINTSSAYMMARLTAYSHDALTNIANIALNGKKEDVKLRANQDIMDRSGNSAKINGARGNADSAGELRIVYIDGEKQVEVQVGR